jgi:hypothetical protein
VLVIATISFLIGLIAGVYLKGIVFDNQEWGIMKWDGSSLGYRPIKMGSTLRRNDRVIMALHLNTESFPEEGIKYDE